MRRGCRADRKYNWRSYGIGSKHLCLYVSSACGRCIGGELKIGELVEIVGQHACLTAAAYPWYYIVDSDMPQAGDAGKEVVDIWVPWKGW